MFTCFTFMYLLFVKWYVSLLCWAYWKIAHSFRRLRVTNKHFLILSLPGTFNLCFLESYPIQCNGKRGEPSAIQMLYTYYADAGQSEYKLQYIYTIWRLNKSGQ